MSEVVFIRVPHNFVDLTGRQFGRLTVLRYAGSVNRKTRWECVCSCGVIKNITYQNLMRGHTKSCGCLHIDELKARTKHGGRHTTEYNAWCGMRQRCTNPRTVRWKDYGGRGIKVCAEWMHDFAAFLRDVGHRPSSDHTLDRINNDGNYEPGNVRWATRSEQSINRRPFVILKNRKTHCPLGHPYSDENTYRWNGTRRCLMCKRRQGRETKMRGEADARPV